MDIAAIGDLILKAGLMGAIAIYLIWRTDKRADALATQLAELWEYCLNQYSATISESSAALRENARTNREVVKALTDRPCLRDHPRPDNPHDYHPTALRKIADAETDRLEKHHGS